MNSDNRVPSVIRQFIRKLYFKAKHTLYRLNPLEDFFMASAQIPPCNNPSVDFKNRSAILDTFQEIISLSGKTVPGRTICDCFFDEEIQNKTILLVGLGRSVRGNLQYILNELNYNDAFEGYQIYIRTLPHTDDIVKEYIKNNRWDRTETVLNDRQYSKLLESARYCLAESNLPESWMKKPGQIYINTWHGTPLKKLGLEKNQKNKHSNGVTQINFINADYLLYPNNYTREKLLASYKVEPLMSGQALMLGYPRTGGMLAAAQEDLSSVRQQLAPNGEIIYAYMPTYRDYLEDSVSVAQIKELLDYLDENLQTNQLLYVNLHHKVNSSLDFSHYKQIRTFPPDLDSYRLLAASTALITDYSSVFFDYLALKRQIILYVEDYQEYKAKRGMYMDLMELPFDKVQTREELIAALNRGKTYDDEDVLQTYCPYDSSENAQKLCQLFLDTKNGLHLESLSTNDRHRLLIYSEAFEPEEPTWLLSQFVRFCDTSKYEIYLSCDRETVNAEKSGAYPLMHKIPVIGTESTRHLSAMGKVILTLYLEDKLPFEQAMEYLRYDYAAAGIRMYGNAHFDIIIIYDADNPEKLLALATLKAPKLLFLQDHILEKIKSGDRFLRDAVCYTSIYSSRIFVSSKSAMAAASDILPECVKEHLKLLDLSKKL